MFKAADLTDLSQCEPAAVLHQMASAAAVRTSTINHQPSTAAPQPPTLNPQLSTDLLDRLVTPGLICFPIRHHSPACAWRLERLIRQRRPRALLIEGPPSFGALLPLLLDPRAKAPFAVYTSFVDEAPDGSPAPPGPDFGSRRHAAYYPFCDYSPELVALRAGAQSQAAIKFIDLEYAEQVAAQKLGEGAPASPRVESLLAEHHFKRSQYLQALARRTGCRDADDLWDHLFEVRHWTLSTPEFIRAVGVYCHLARADTPAEVLEAEGTCAREAAMAAAIQAELARPCGSTAGPVLVVTGGFHAVALPELVERPLSHHQPVAPAQAHTCLIRYGFAQLDALNGYCAGLPSPAYYDQLWRETRRGSRQPLLDVAATLIVELGQLTRRKGMAIALSPADEIAALEQARRLAALRGHPGPGREDLLDGLRSCFVKGAMDAEGEVIMGLARHVLAGTGVGEVPAEAGAPPLLADFRAVAKQLRLNLGDSVARKISLELYRKARHRQVSRFFHQLGALETPFAELVAGPDFVAGAGLDRLLEHWEYQWTPDTESRLIEASVYGATVEEAAANRLLDAIEKLAQQGQNRSATGAVSLLVGACRQGLHRHTPRLLGLIAAQVAEDPDFNSLVSAIGQLVLLWQSREPLEAHQLPEVPALVGMAYERACGLLHRLVDAPAEGLAEALQSLLRLRELLAAPWSPTPSTAGPAANGSLADSPPLLDAELFWPALEALLNQPRCPAMLAGGVAGLLHGAGRLPDAALLALLQGHLAAARGDAAEQVSFLVGLLATERELAWRQPALVEAIGALLQGWDDEEFIRRLPHLRLAFAGLTPRETDQVAAVVAEARGAKDLGRLVHYAVTEQDVLLALRVNQRVKEALARDGLADWLAAPDPNPDPNRNRDPNPDT